MPVKLMDISSIEVRRFTRPGEKFQGNIRIDHNSTITNVSVHGEDISIEFRFTANYQSLGIIKMEGTALYSTKGNITEIIENYQKTRNLPPESATEVHNSIIQACIPIATYISRDVKLPPPIPLPSVNLKDKKKRSNRKTDSVEIV